MPLYPLELDEFARLLGEMRLRRQINALHLHHTAERSAQWRGRDSLEEMRLAHMKDGLCDIAQHVTIEPLGGIWLGRNWNIAPASAPGANGNPDCGPLMITLVGDFRHEPLEAYQRAAVVRVIALLQERFELGPDRLVLHSQLARCDCPGERVDYANLLQQLAANRAEIRTMPVEEPARRHRPFGPEADLVTEVQESFARTDLAGDRTDAEVRHGAPRFHDAISPLVAGNGRAVPRGDAELSPGVLASLRPHVITLKQGQFDEGGVFRTRRSDVDAIFEQHLEKEMATLPEGKKLRILFYAHGGLVGEALGLQIAANHVSFWRGNGVYPIYFVWESGLLQTIAALLSPWSRLSGHEDARDIFDHTTDPAVEAASRAFGGVKIWGGMKASAELASAPDGGARYTADLLKAFCDRYPGRVELHAVGHSGGSNFHAAFLPAALALGCPSFESLHFMAPAVTIHTFRQRLLACIGDTIRRFAIFTMQRDWEEADNCINLYHKSLPYLIHYALEPQRETPLLGLEISLRDDSYMRDLLGLSGRPGAKGEVIWSKTASTTGRNASHAIHHGDFDNDPPTMESIARRVLGLPDSAQLPQEYVEPRGVVARFDAQLRDIVSLLSSGPAPSTVPHVPPRISPAPTSAPPAIPSSGGRRTALCVGINSYNAKPLQGCVADARDWEGVLRSLGFEQIALLLDTNATRDNILGQLRALLKQSRPGDVIVFQYSGHGTQVPDLSGDDDDSQDEAIVPVDYDMGHFIIDDDLAALFGGIPVGVSFTSFLDCCHSGTASRFAVGSPSASREVGAIGRYLPATAAMADTHKRFREGLRATSRGPATMRDVLFSACQPYEVAFEENGHGDFTRTACQVLQTGAIGLTNQEFHNRLLAALGSSPRQRPSLDCAPNSLACGFLQPLDGPAPSRDLQGSRRNGTDRLAGALYPLADLLRG